MNMLIEALLPSWLAARSDWYDVHRGEKDNSDRLWRESSAGHREFHGWLGYGTS